jgi:hypothetical protein
MNLSLRSGVPFVPSHRNQPDGIDPMAPDHIVMMPAAIASKFPAVFVPSDATFIKPGVATKLVPPPREAKVIVKAPVALFLKTHFPPTPAGNW